MPCYLIERICPERLTVLDPAEDAQAHRLCIENNTRAGVTWLHSYIAPDGKKSFCIYDAPAPEAIRRAAEYNGLPVDRITEVQMLAP
jgi:hypothetical protein